MEICPFYMQLYKTQSGNALLTDRVKSLNILNSQLLRQSNEATAQLLACKRDIDELSANKSERETQVRLVQHTITSVNDEYS